MKKPLIVGKVATVTQFTYVNKHGGTGASWNNFDGPIFKGSPPSVRITKTWHDYETGQRAWAVAVSPALKRYMKRNANPADQRIFVGEFDLVRATAQS